MAWRVSLIGHPAHLEDNPAPSEHPERADALEEFIGWLQSLDVFTFGPYVQCTCGEETCPACDIQGDALAYIRDTGMVGDHDLEFSASLENAGLAARAGVRLERV